MTIRWASERNGDEPDAGIFAFERTYDGETVLVVINVSDDHASETSYAWDGGDHMQTSFAQGTELVNLFADSSDVDDEVTVGQDGRLNVTVPARGAKIYVAQ